MMQISMIKTDTINPAAYNPRKDLKDGDPEYERIKKSINEFGLVEPLVLNHDMTLISGHQRLKVLCGAGFDEVPCVIVDLDKKHEAALNVAMNKITGQWDFAKLKDIISEIDIGEFDIELTGFGDDELKKMFDFESPNKLPFGEDLNSSLIHDLKDNVKFPSDNKWGIPDIRPDVVIDCDCPVIYSPVEKNDGLVFWNYNSDSTKNIDWKKCIVGFYVDDSRFETIWDNTKEHITAMVNRKIEGMVAPNFSAYYEWPGAMRMWNVFRSRWIARYAQEAGIKIILDISGSKDDFDWMFLGIPKGFPICFQIHREKKENFEHKNLVIEKTIETVSPSIVWCYGQKEKAEFFPALKRVDCRWITPRTVKMRQRMKENAQDG